MATMPVITSATAAIVIGSVIQPPRERGLEFNVASDWLTVAS